MRSLAIACSVLLVSLTLACGSDDEGTSGPGGSGGTAGTGGGAGASGEAGTAGSAGTAGNGGIAGTAGNGMAGDGGSSGTAGNGGSAGGAGGAAGGENCSAEATKDQCDACCRTEIPDGPAAMAGVIAACLCKPEFCEASCGDFCADPASATGFSTECQTCYVDAFSDASYQQCYQTEDANCQTDAICGAYSACITSCMDLP